jgi:predicted AlkP superfamily pyrophosphatase or phosphodiesterase
MSSRRLRRLPLACIGAFVSVLGCMSATASPVNTPVVVTAAGAPKLIVFITVDQLRGDMLDRYRADLRYGYARLMRGAWFVNGFQDHAITETAPGHASTMSGRFPRSTGIVSNLVGVIDPNYRLLAGSGIGASPTRFQGTTLFDWLYAKNRRTRALSVSMKDRAAILTIGRAKQDVYWYSPSGVFTTSNYYRDALPAWVQRFNARRIVQGYAGAEWRLSRNPAAYPEPDSVVYENRGRNYTFPHAFPDDTSLAGSYVMVTPTIDSLTALLALQGLRETGIGLGAHTDILAVSFSATDIIGHTYGPDSREARENQLRLDETIGWFLDSLYRIRDSSTVAVALTGDHGVGPIRELARERGEATGNEGLLVNLRPLVSQIHAGLRAVGADTTAFRYLGDQVALNRPALNAARLNADSLLDFFARSARQVPGVARVDRLSTLRRADFAADPIARRWSHQLAEDSPVELVITLTKFSVWYETTATHGSPYDYDAHVPIIFYGPWAKPGRYASFVRVVDMGPTLAAMAGVRPLEKLDGVVLVDALRR